MSTEKKKKLTLKQTLFIKYYFEQNGNGTQAARLAGYKGTENSIRVIAHNNLTKDNIMEAIARIYKINGLTDENLLKKHIQLLNAQREFVIGDVKCKSPDNGIQLGALKLAYEVNGKLVKKVEVKILTKEERYARINRLRGILSEIPE